MLSGDFMVMWGEGRDDSSHVEVAVRDESQVKPRSEVFLVRGDHAASENR
jgi:hypothetical protein